MSDLYKVEVLKRDRRTVELRLDFTRWQTTVPVSRSFACMLIEDESAPGHADWDRWQNATWAQDENWNLKDHLVRVEVKSAEGLPRGDDGKARRGMDLDDRGSCGVVTLEIEVDEDGPLDHLVVGHRWGTTAYGKLGDIYFAGNADDLRVWRR